MDWRSRITFEPGKRGGKPCIRGLRITVTDVLEYLASGMTEDEILQDFPDLEREGIRACLAFAAERERRLERRRRRGYLGVRQTERADDRIKRHRLSPT